MSIQGELDSLYDMQSTMHKPGVLDIVLEKGDAVIKPQPEDIVEVEYTGWLFDRTQHANYYKGKQFATGKAVNVIGNPNGEKLFMKGWEIAIPKMALGQKSMLLLASNYAYDER
ncbi:MAG: hypothetical protein M1840_008486 [Geoglossum simile]|nr:MAG: hypothetical protein M1840_008486 [Geoglossum simile]